MLGPFPQFIGSHVSDFELTDKDSRNKVVMKMIVIAKTLQVELNMIKIWRRCIWGKEERIERVGGKH